MTYYTFKKILHNTTIEIEDTNRKAKLENMCDPVSTIISFTYQILSSCDASNILSR